MTDAEVKMLHKKCRQYRNKQDKIMSKMTDEERFDYYSSRSEHVNKIAEELGIELHEPYNYKNKPKK
jgi:hypothetical protein